MPEFMISGSAIWVYSGTLDKGGGRRCDGALLRPLLASSISPLPQGSEAVIQTDSQRVEIERV